MRNSSLLYSHQRPTYPDNTAYTPASADMRPPATMALNRTTNAAPTTAASIIRDRQTQPATYRQRDVSPGAHSAGSTGERLSYRNNNNNNSAGEKQNNSSATTGNSSPRIANTAGQHNGGSAHQRSASLLGRLRHSASASPTGSPTSSEGSSRDTSRSDRTLAHSASSGSMRKRKQQPMQRTHLSHTDDVQTVSHIPSASLIDGARALKQQTSRPLVRVLPPQADAARSPARSAERGASPASKSGRKRHSLRSGDSRSTSGFISNLLRGSSRNTKPTSPNNTGDSPADSASSRKFGGGVHSPGTPRSQPSPPQEFGNGGGEVEFSHPPPMHHHHAYAGFPPPTVCTVEYPPICMAADASGFTATDMHGALCADHAQHQPGVFCVQASGSECMEAEGAPNGVAMAPVAMANGNMASAGDFYYMAHNNGSSNIVGQTVDGLADPAGDGGTYPQPEAWYEAGTDKSGGIGDTAQMAGRLVSSLPVYEPIDLSRVHTMHHGYARATRPVLPDARMLAPMTSLAEVYGSGAADYAALSTRELRFAVENHMLIEQHKYLIRDLGHARSAIGALKQVVQDKEDRLEQFEMANVELQQRLVLVESLLTQDQRDRIETLRYSLGPASSALSTAQVDGDDGASARQAQGADQDSILSARQDSSDDRNASTGGGPTATHPVVGVGVGMAGPASPASQNSKQDQSSSKRSGRPLSGYATHYALNTKPVHQLPRVFSGDYSASDVQAMEHSVEALASAITSMPPDDTSVEEIIASKMAEDDQHIRDQIRADAVNGDIHVRHLARDDHAESPQEPKRRSRFLSMLRLSTFGSSSPSARDQNQNQDTSQVRQKRRSVSLGNRNPIQLQNEVPGSAGGAPQRSTSAAHHDARDTASSLAASCPTLLPGAAKPRLHTRVPSSAGSRIYPSGLGLSTEEEEASSAASSRQPSTMTSSTVGGRARNAANQEVASSKHDPRRRRLSHRMSLTGQPRRSTSAPSRPHSMRMSRRKSWLFQLFGSSPSVDSATSSDTADDVSDHGSDDARCRRVSRRRRVLTQSSDEITQFLGHLRLEDSGNGGGTHVGELRVPAAHINDVLEDVIDVSGEDEELANRPSMSVAEVRQQTLDTLNGTVRVTQQPPSILDSMTGRCEQTGVADGPSPLSANSVPVDRCSPRSVASSTCSKAENHSLDHDIDCESVDQSISRWRQRDASGPTITRLNPPAVTSTSPGNSPTKDSASNRPGQASSLGLGVSVARRDRTPVSYLPSITQTAASHSPVTPTRKEWSIGDGKSPASASGSGTGTPTRHMRQSSGTSIQSDDSSAVARKWAPAFWAPPSLNYHAGEPLGSPTAAGGSSWSPRESIDSVERRPSYTRRPSEESRYRSPHGSIGLQPPAAGSGGGPPPPASIGRNGGASGSPWELVKFSESRSFPLSPSHSRPGTPPSRQLGFFEDTTVPDSDELTVAARRSLSLRMSRNAFRQVEPLPESDDVSESSSVRKLDGGDGKRDGRRTSRIRSEGKQAADGLADASSKPKQDQAKNPALSRVAGSAQHKRRSLLWQFKEAKNSSSSSTVVASKTLSGQQLAQNEPSSLASSTHEYSETASDTRDMMSHTPRGGSDFLASDRPSEHTSHQNLAAVTSGTKKHKRWWSVVLG